MYKDISKPSDKTALTVPDSRSVAPYASQATSASDTQPAPLDLLMNAWLGKLTMNVSPAAMTNAFGDWLMQLQLSPSKQDELVKKAVKKYWRWWAYACNPLRDVAIGTASQGRKLAPLPQDHRFSDPAWEQWPFNVIYQGFLQNQQWWHNATTGVRGVSPHHEDVVNFTVRQYLDMLAPSNFMMTNPVVLNETVRTGGSNLLRGMQNFIDDLQKIAAPNAVDGDAPFTPGKTVAITPGKVIYRNRLIELIQYAPTTATVHSTPILFVPAWIMKYYILDLSPENSLVKYLVDNGHTVFMVSWKNPGSDDRDLSLEDYRRLGVMDAIDAVTEATRAPQINAVGYCLGGTLLTIAAAAMAHEGDKRLGSISLFAAQADFEEPGELSLFIDENQISFLEAAMWEKGYLDTRQMAGAFQLLRSNDLIWSYRLNEYLLGKKPQNSDLMAWNADATRMPYRMHSEYLRQLFLHNDLAEGRYHVDGHAISLADIAAPIFAVGTVTDHVAPWRSVFKLQRLTATEVTFLLTTGGHNAGVVSPPGQPHRSYQVSRHANGDLYIDPDAWQSTVTHQDGSWWPEWEHWLAAHAGKRKKAPAIQHEICAAPGTYVMQK
jgi:polyhydroxyalkanoate synthase